MSLVRLLSKASGVAKNRYSQSQIIFPTCGLNSGLNSILQSHCFYQHPILALAVLTIMTKFMFT